MLKHAQSRRFAQLERRPAVAERLDCVRFNEFGPGAALSGFMKRIDKTAQMLNVADAASLEATVKALA